MNKSLFLTNKLFADMDTKQREKLLLNFDKIILSPQQTLIVEGEISDTLYILQSGQLQVFRHDVTTGNKHILATIQAGEYVGELGILDAQPRSATVYALTTSTLFAISQNKLKQLENEDAILYGKLIKNLASIAAERLRKSNNDIVQFLTSIIQAEQIRLNMGRLLILLLIIFSLYPMVLKILDIAADYTHLPSIVIPITSFLLIFVLSFSSVLFIRHSGYPIAFFGLTMQNWRIALRESLLYSLILIVTITLLKWLAISLIPSFEHIPILDLGGFYPERGAVPSAQTRFIFGCVYVIFAPLQEFITRGCLQGSLKHLLLTPHAKWVAIIIASLLFSSLHLSVGLLLSICIFPFGLFWGWMYERHQTLLGVCVSHIIVGFWALYIIGVLRVLQF